VDRGKERGLLKIKERGLDFLLADEFSFTGTHNSSPLISYD
jgi:hypothetical protein